MRGPGREEKAAAALLRIARARAVELQSRLTDVEAAIKSAETSLTWLAEAVEAEKASRSGDPKVAVEFARFLGGAAEKRTSLESTRATLSEEKRAVEAMLGEARAEMAKLDRLIAVSRRAAARRRPEGAGAVTATPSATAGRRAV
jgi:hypothetical protein